MELSYFNKVTEKSNKEISISDTYNIIANGKLQKATERIRNEADKDKRNKLKVSLLPAVTVSGTFKNGTHRAADFKEHSGLMQIDIDNCPADLLSEYKENLKADKYTNCCFVSPSGNGLKCIVKVEPSKEKHPDIFRALEKYYKDKYGFEIDTKTKDISRLMFLCSDTDIYINENSERFKAPEPKKPKPQQNKIQQYDNDTLADIEKVVNQIESRKIDITGSYENWLSVGFALADELGTTGADYFHRISRFHPDYNFEKAQKQFDKCLKNRKNNGISPFFALARKYNIDTVSVKKTAHKQKNKPKTKDKPQAEPAENDLLKPIPLHSKDETKAFLEYDFFKRDGCYWKQEHKRGKTFDVRISNFLLESLYNLEDGTNNTKRIIKLQNKKSEINLIEVLSSETRIDSFETILKSKQCTFKGTGFDLKNIFEYLMDNEQTATEITTLGLHPETENYALADAIINTDNQIKSINELGIIKDKDNVYYLPAFASTNLKNDDYENERLLQYREGTTDFKTWASLFYNAYGINGGIGIMYTILSVFRDIVFNSKRFFPFMFLFGDFGTGKTNFTNNIIKVFGNFDGTDINQSTNVGLARTASQRINSVFYFKEFTPQTDKSIYNFILNAYDGVGRTTGKKTVGNQTKDLKVKSGIIFDGNYLPIENTAVYSRLLVMKFEKQSFSDIETKAFKDLKKRSENGFGLVLKEILEHREYFKEMFFKTFNDNIDKIKNTVDFSGLGDRLQEHLALLVTPYNILSKKLDFPFSLKELQLKMIDYVKEQKELLNEIKDVSIFWEALNYTKKNEPYKFELNKHYYKDEPQKGFGYIYINYKETYPIYHAYCKNNNFNISDRESLRALLTSEAYKPFKPGKDQKQAVKNNTRCYKFEYIKKDGITYIDDLPVNL